MKLAFEWGIQAIVYSSYMLVQAAQKLKNKITGKDRENQTGNKVTPTQTQGFIASEEQENKTGLLELKEKLSTPESSTTTVKATEPEKIKEEVDVNPAKLKEFTQELRQELEVYIEKDEAETPQQNLVEEKKINIEDIDISSANWLKEAQNEETPQLNWEEESEKIEEISWVKKAQQKRDSNAADKAENKPEDWLEEISEQVTAFDRQVVEENKPQEQQQEKALDPLQEFTTVAKEETQPQFDRLEEITDQTVDFGEIEEVITEKVIELDPQEKKETGAQFESTPEIIEETENLPNYQEQPVETKNVALVPTKTRSQQKLIPKIKEYASDLIFIASKLIGKLNVGFTETIEKVKGTVTNKENLDEALEKSKIIFRNTIDFLLDKFGEYSGRIKDKIDDLDLKSIDINKSLNMREGTETDLELKSYLLSGIQNYIKDTDIAYKELNLDSDKAKQERPKITPDWLDTTATTIGYVKQPLQVILQLLDRILYWIEETVADLWFWVREKIAKMRNK
ncbi:MAG: hypothetical protein QNJ38_15640 [Prochloraceae cyanobacterium]|nr:hypothetical protein [Prochloraceae cyanobacterium]